MDASQQEAAAANEAAWQQYYAAQAQQEVQQHSWNEQYADTQWQQQQQQNPYPASGQQVTWPEMQSKQQQHLAVPAQSPAIVTQPAPQPSEVQVDRSGPDLDFNAASKLAEADSGWAPGQQTQSAAPPLPPPASDGGKPSEPPPLPPLPPSEGTPQPPDDSSPPPPPPLPSSETLAEFSMMPPPETLQHQQGEVGSQATSTAAASSLQTRNDWAPEQSASWQQQWPQVQASNGAEFSGSQHKEWTEQQIAEWHQHNQQQQYWQQQQQQQQGEAQWQHQGGMQWHQQPPQQSWQQLWPGYTVPQPHGPLHGHPHLGAYTPAAGWTPSAAYSSNAAAQLAPSPAMPVAAYNGLQGVPNEAPISGVTAPPVVSAMSLFFAPGRSQRPTRIAVLLRGPPGSGKSTAARKIREAELAAGGEAPRTHTLDDYFFTDVEKEVDDEKRKGKKKKTTVVEYEYDAEMEDAYEASLVKAFARTVRDGKSRVVVVDAPLLRAATVHDLWRLAQGASYEVFVADSLESDPEVCYSRNVHNRTLDDVRKAAAALEPPPAAFLRLDLLPLFEGSGGGAATNSPQEDNSAAMDVEFTSLSSHSPAPLPPSNGSRDGSCSDSGGDGGTPPRMTGKSRWADPDDDDGAEEAHLPSTKKRRTSRVPTSAAAAAMPLNDPVACDQHSHANLAGMPTVKNACVASKLRGILTAGGSNGSNQRVKWPDEQNGADTSDATFVVGGACKEQLETVWVLDGLGPAAGDEPHALSGAPASFEDMVKGDHVGEKQAFQRKRLDRGRH